MPDENIKKILEDLRDIYHDVSRLCGDEGSITVDLGLVNETDYYTDLIIKGYLQGYGDEVLSGGRYDKLISEFGYDVTAIGFAVNVNAVAKLIEKNGIIPAMPRIDAIVYAENGFEVNAIKTAQSLREQGLTVETALFDDIETVRSYAIERQIPRVIVVNSEEEEQ